MTGPTCITVNNLAEFEFIAGNYYELSFDVYDEAGNAVDITSASCSWRLAPYGDPSVATLTKSGSVSGSPVNNFKIILSSDTATLGGKYIQQPVVVNVDGKTYRPGQGVITIQPQIP